MKVRRRNFQSIQHGRMNHGYCVGLNPGWKKTPFQYAVNKTFYPTPQPLTHRRSKHRQRTKIIKQCFLKLCKCSQIPHPSPKEASTSNRTKINHHLLNHLQTLHTHTHTLNYATSQAVGPRGTSQTPGVAKGNLDLISFPHST